MIFINNEAKLAFWNISASADTRDKRLAAMFAREFADLMELRMENGDAMGQFFKEVTMSIFRTGRYDMLHIKMGTRILNECWMHAGDGRRCSEEMLRSK